MKNNNNFRNQHSVSQLRNKLIYSLKIGWKSIRFNVLFMNNT